MLRCSRRSVAAWAPPAAAQPARDPLAEVAVVVGVEAVEGEGARASRPAPGAGSSSPGRHGRPAGRQTLRNPAVHGSRPRLASVASTALDQPVPGREAGRCVLDRRRQHRIAGEPPPAAVGVGPGPDRARDRDGERTAQRDAVQAPRAQCRGVHAARRAPGAVERDLLAGRLVPDQPERVAADPAAVGHDHAQHGVRGDRRVDRVPARAPGRRAPRPSRGGAARRRLPGSHARAGRGRAAGSGIGSSGRHAAHLVLVPAQPADRQEGDARRISDATKIPSSPAAWAATPPTMLPTIWPRPRNTE